MLTVDEYESDESVTAVTNRAIYLAEMLANTALTATHGPRPPGTV